MRPVDDVPERDDAVIKVSQNCDHGPVASVTSVTSDALARERATGLRPYDDAATASNVDKATRDKLLDLALEPQGGMVHGQCRCGGMFTVWVLAARRVVYMCPCGWSSTVRGPNPVEPVPKRDEPRRGHIVTPMAPDELLREVARQAAKLTDQRETIRGLMADRDVARTERAQRGDELGAAHTRIRDLEAECFRLRRRAEDAERKAGKR